jgi:hypothetical protein
MKIRSYTDLRRFDTLVDRFEYLALGGVLGETTFGFDRWVNQQFYHGTEWRHVRNYVIARDEGFDLGAKDSIIRGPHYIHHMNPITRNDIEEGTENLLDPEFLITTSLRTHNAIHYGDKSLLPQDFVERRPGDTRLWDKLK